MRSTNTGIGDPRREPGEPDEGGEGDAAEESAELQAGLLEGVPDDPAELDRGAAPRWLLAQLLDYHRREAKPV